MLDPVLHHGQEPRSFAQALRQLIADRERSLAAPNLHPVRQALLRDELARYQRLLGEEERSEKIKLSLAPRVSAQPHRKGENRCHSLNIPSRPNGWRGSTR